SHFRWLALVLAVPTLLGTWIDYVFPGLPRIPLLLGFHLVAALLFGFTIAAILQAIHKEPRLSADPIYGPLYRSLVVGAAFGHLYWLTEALRPGSVHGSEEFSTQAQMDDRHHFMLTYFSFVTLTSVGYGDITPGSGTVRSLAIIEAILGQFYIAV